jgi:hypothetical protein
MTSLKPSLHEIQVSTVSPEEASYGVAELWAGGELIAYTHLDEGDLMLRIDPRRDGAPVEVGVHSLVVALAEANDLLAHDGRQTNQAKGTP